MIIRNKTKVRRQKAEDGKTTWSAKGFYLLLPSVLCLLPLFLSACRSTAALNSPPLVCFEKNCYKVDIVSTPSEREKGLMFRSGLRTDEGMFFVFERRDIFQFWMKNMRFPIDIIWLDANREEGKNFTLNAKVVDMAADVPPCDRENCPVYTPSQKAIYAIEIPAGDSVRRGIRVGSKARIMLPQ